MNKDKNIAKRAFIAGITVDCMNSDERLDEIFNSWWDDNIKARKETLEISNKKCNLASVKSSFSDEDMLQAWEDGCGCGEDRSGVFNIENYY